MGIEENSLLFLCGWNPLFQLVGFGIAFEVYRMPAVVHTFQNADYRAVLPVVRIIRECFPFSFGVIGFRNQYVIRFENVRYLCRSFSADT